MPRLDPLIERLFKTPGSELLLGTGEGIVLKAPQGQTALIKQPLSTPQIIGALAEIVPEDLKAGFPEEGVSGFPYLSPHGAVRVELNHGGPMTTAVLKPLRSAPAAPAELPPDDDGEAMELVSPADMMNLAAQAMGAPAARRAPEPPARPATPKAPPAARPAAPVPVARASAPGAAPGKMASLLELMLSRRASDLHLSSGTVPRLRVDGDIVPLDGWPELSGEQVKELLWEITPHKSRAEWEERRDTDFAHETEAARFRVNVFEDRKGIGSVMRQIPNEIITAEAMGLSKAILDLCFLSKGLVLVTGPTGSGKSTTLAALIDYINRNREDHIITIEDPIEFVHPNKKCLVNQREVGIHTASFKQALRGALREDPDIVLVGELRDLETIAIAIETAETGHLVFGTLHTNTAPSTVDRIIDQFPADRQGQIRTMLSESLKGVISQTLCKKIGGGRAPALEVLLVPGSVSNLIREGKTFQIPSIMQTGRGLGMVTMNDALFDLVKRKVVEPKEAYVKSVAKAELKAMLDRAGIRFELAHPA